MAEFTHFDDRGASRMVDVGDKPISHRVARAEATVHMKAATWSMIADRALAKGDVLEVARLAGIMAVKRTADLIPLCHPLSVSGATIDFTPPRAGSDEDTVRLRIESQVKVDGKTGVEMEALVAVSTAALTVYDMCKSVDREMEIEKVRLLEKSGGKSGHFKRDAQ